MPSENSKQSFWRQLFCYVLGKKQHLWCKSIPFTSWNDSFRALKAMLWQRKTIAFMMWFDSFHDIKPMLLQFWKNPVTDYQKVTNYEILPVFQNNLQSLDFIARKSRLRKSKCKEKGVKCDILIFTFYISSIDKPDVVTS